MKDKRKPQIRKNVYLFELDSVRKTDEEIEVAQNALLDEIVLNGNVVVMTYNQLVDSRGFFSLLCNEKYEEKLIRLFEMGAIRISRFGDVRTVSQYLLNSVDADLGISFEDTVYGKLMEDYGGHPFLTRQVCSKINNDLNARHVKRPTVVTRNSYSLKCDEYKQGMTSVIEQILGVIENYYPGEFELLKRLALDGRESFRKEIALGNIGIQHLIGYCIIEKENGEYFIRIKSIEDYIKSKFVYDATLTEQKDKRARINIRRDNIEEGLRELIQFSLKSKYGKKAKDQLIAMVDKTTQDSTQKTKMINAVSLKDAIQELYFSQIKIIMEKDWKYYEKLFPDKTKFEAYMDVLNKSRSAGAHTRTISADDEVIYNIAFDFFEEAIKED